MDELFWDTLFYHYMDEPVKEADKFNSGMTEPSTCDQSEEEEYWDDMDEDELFEEEDESWWDEEDEDDE